MTSKIQLRRGTASQWTTINPILADGEPGVEKDTGRIKFGDGTRTWSSLPYSSLTSVTYSMLPSGTTLTVVKSGSVWPNRPTSRTDIVVVWKGAAPAPATGGTGMISNDYYLP